MCGWVGLEDSVSLTPGKVFFSGEVHQTDPCLRRCPLAQAGKDWKLASWERLVLDLPMHPQGHLFMCLMASGVLPPILRGREDSGYGLPHSAEEKTKAPRSFSGLDAGQEGWAQGWELPLFFLQGRSPSPVPSTPAAPTVPSPALTMWSRKAHLAVGSWVSGLHQWTAGRGHVLAHVQCSLWLGRAGEGVQAWPLPFACTGSSYPGYLVLALEINPLPTWQLPARCSLAWSPRKADKSHPPPSTPQPLSSLSAGTGGVTPALVWLLRLPGGPWKAPLHSHSQGLCSSFPEWLPDEVMQLRASGEEAAGRPAGQAPALLENGRLWPPRLRTEDAKWGRAAEKGSRTLVLPHGGDGQGTPDLCSSPGLDP
jgi:hypothetical protein